MSATTVETIVDVADRLFTATEKSDKAAVDRLWSNDIAVWLVGARRDPAKTDDKARALRVIDWFISIIDLHAGLHRDQSGRRRPDRPDRRILRPGRDRAVDRLARATEPTR